MPTDNSFLLTIERSVSDGLAWPRDAGLILTEMAADSGTIHLLGEDGVLHLKAASTGIPQVMLDTIQEVPVGKGMAGLAVERKEPVNACNIQTDTSGDVRPGARVTGLQGSVVFRCCAVMMRWGRSAWQIAARGRSPARKNSCCWRSAACWRAIADQEAQGSGSGLKQNLQISARRFCLSPEP